MRNKQNRLCFDVCFVRRNAAMLQDTTASASHTHKDIARVGVRPLADHEPCFRGEVRIDSDDAGHDLAIAGAGAKDEMKRIGVTRDVGSSAPQSENARSALEPAVAVEA